MSGVVLRVHGVATTDEWFADERYLQSWDVEAFDGRGDADLTTDITKAHRFADHEDAIRAWQTQSVTRPMRPDGLPNRPLTAFHVEMVTVP